MKSFDAEWSGRRAKDARSFQLCGETFVMKTAVRPEALAVKREIPDGAPIEVQMEALDALILSMIELDGDAEARWMAIRARDDDGLSLADVKEVTDWLIEHQTGRPPTSQSGSQHGRTQTGTRSTVASSSRALSAA